MLYQYWSIGALNVDRVFAMLFIYIKIYIFVYDIDLYILTVYITELRFICLMQKKISSSIKFIVFFVLFFDNNSFMTAVPIL